MNNKLIIARGHDRPVMTAGELRQLLDLHEGNGQYGRKSKKPDVGRVPVRDYVLEKTV